MPPFRITGRLGPPGAADKGPRDAGKAPSQPLGRSGSDASDRAAAEPVVADLPKPQVTPRAFLKAE